MNGNDNGYQNANWVKAAVLRYLMVVGVIVGAFVVVGGGALALYSAFGAGGGTGGTFFNFSPIAGSKQPGGANSGLNGLPDDQGAMPARTTALVLGVNDGLADTIFLATYNAADGRTDVLSIPRDTKITLPQEDVAQLRSLGRVNTPSHGVMKLNELYSYAGAEYGPAYMRDYIERMLDMKIDYHVIFSTSAFRAVVDLVDGIDIEVPQLGSENGMHYVTDEGLVIDLYPGMQHLNGRQAEGFVRYRHGEGNVAVGQYAKGDLGRIEAQQAFMKAFFEQALTKEKIRQNWAGFASTFIGCVKTDFGLEDVLRYLPAVESLSAANVAFHQLPGDAPPPAFVGAPYYFIYDAAAARQMVDELFYTSTFISQSADAPVSDNGSAAIDKSLNVEVLNGTTVGGLAGRKADELRLDGYNVSETGTYEGTSRAQTRVMAREPGKGGQFLPYFKDAVVEVDPAIPKPFDVIIIIGTSEK